MNEKKNKKIINSDNKSKLKNLIYSVSATAIFNMVIQFLIYPFFQRKLGGEAYGVALSLISLVAITAGTCGYAVNCSRVLGVEKGRTDSGNYNLILLSMGVICSVIGFAYMASFNMLSVLGAVLFTLLMFTTLLRYYSEVEFRMRTDFFKYMIYYILISVGYIVGLWAFSATGQWMVALIIGETLAFVYVCVCGTIYRPPFFKKTADLRPILASVMFILLSALIDNITLHADRILLLAITGDGTAVSIYYVASLVGKIIAMLTLPINSLILSYLSRYKGELTRKTWSMVIGAATVFGAVAFAGCMIVSPLLIKILYPDMAQTVSKYFLPAILGQIFYFVSGVLMIILLRFKGEKKQFVFNAAYAVEFFGCVAVGTAIGGLWGFVWSVFLANAIRFVLAILWGFVGKKRISDSK